jgi:hypothetical protein
LALPLILAAIFSIILLLPLGPFIHRFTYQIPCFLFLVFVGTLIYNLLAFPFSANNRYKAYFLQTVDLESGQNEVGLFGLKEYIRPIIASLPSAAGQGISCISRDEIKPGLKCCSWKGLAPRVVPNVPAGVPPEKGYTDWLSYNVSRVSGQNSARFNVSAQNSRACVLRFDSPIKICLWSDDNVEGVIPGLDEIRRFAPDWSAVSKARDGLVEGFKRFVI